MSSNINWRRWRSWLIGITIFLAGIGLIISDRIAAGNPARQWIIPSTPVDQYLHEAKSKPILGGPWPKAIPQLAVSGVYFYDTRLKDVVREFQDDWGIRLVINWHVLAPFDIDERSTITFTHNASIPLTDFLDTLVKEISRTAPECPQLAWEAQPGRIVYLSTAHELSRDRECRLQRLENASAALRKKLDHQIPYVRLEDLTLDEALRYAQRLSGITIRFQDPGFNRSNITTVIAQDITFEQMIELLARCTRGDSSGTWHFVVEGEGLLLLREKGSQ